MWTLEQVGPAGSPLIDLVDAKTHLRVTHAAEDGLIANQVLAGTEHAELFQRRTLLQRTWRLSLPRFPKHGALLRLPRPPVQSVTTIVYTDPDGVERTMPGTDYRLLDDGRVTPEADAWPATKAEPDAVRVTYLAGYSVGTDLPWQTRAAILLLVGNLYENREASLVATGPTFALPYGVEPLLWPRRVLDRDPIGD